MGCKGLVDTTDPKIGSLAKIVSITGDSIPFLKLNGRQAYRVALKDVHVAVKRFNGADTILVEGIRDFEVYLDPSTGQLLKIVSTLPSYEGKVASGEIRVLSVDEAEKQMIRYHYGQYSGFPAADPKASFLDVFQAMPGDPVRPDRLIGYFVEHKIGGKASAPRWILETYGAESGTTGHYPMRRYQLNHTRAIIDVDGRLVMWTNRPYVED